MVREVSIHDDYKVSSGMFDTMDVSSSYRQNESQLKYCELHQDQYNLFSNKILILPITYLEIITE